LKKTHHKKGLVEWLQGVCPGFNPQYRKKKKKKKKRTSTHNLKRKNRNHQNYITYGHFSAYSLVLQLLEMACLLWAKPHLRTEGTTLTA
jgi:regulator of sigma D